jgi:hypothetical protein|tara:strand:+ start:140 stop:472 length:333 start_codon:yes stop_codon:yes gene_type:complete
MMLGYRCQNDLQTVTVTAASGTTLESRVLSGIVKADEALFVRSKKANAFHSWLKGWIHPFHGVATKYLDNYLGWLRFLGIHENTIKTKQTIQSAIVLMGTSSLKINYAYE